MPESYPDKIVRVRPGDDNFETRRTMNYFTGISENTAGSQGISMNRVVVPPGGKPAPHSHVGFEAVIYIVSGRVENFYGDGLKESIITEAGDFLYIPPGVPHQPINMSDTEEAVAIIARTISAERETDEPYNPDES
ncbi:MAG: cupin domain-containing protein [Candidatus Nitronauta litoralis]|uniref:Cupin domain-containing protein n=1 Tax=Candidatus Nitronauta litoralis TaxID=2705533 RepID=A0A7T0BTQ5_9BACT|nr:MAG: cupin domain-containing protein [Candidatus Nitronauta litoralis]